MNCLCPAVHDWWCNLSFRTQLQFILKKMLRENTHFFSWYCINLIFVFPAASHKQLKPRASWKSQKSVVYSAEICTCHILQCFITCLSGFKYKPLFSSTHTHTGQISVQESDCSSCLVSCCPLALGEAPRKYVQYGGKKGMRHDKQPKGQRGVIVSGKMPVVLWVVGSAHKVVKTWSKSNISTSDWTKLEGKTCVHEFI